MKYGRWTLGQVEALLNKLGGEENARGILNGTIEFTITTRTRELLSLAREQFGLLPTMEFFNPSTYFKTREGLLVLNGFKTRILSLAFPIKGPAYEISPYAFDLVKSANDDEIRRELPGDYVFEDASEFCSILAEMINLQFQGEEGVLLTNGCVNIFYVRSKSSLCVVTAAWDIDEKRWCVGAYLLSESRWDETHRVFSRNCPD